MEVEASVLITGEDIAETVAERNSIEMYVVDVQERIRK
jgi:hypothetical protein